jgi:uncharacterized protein
VLNKDEIIKLLQMNKQYLSDRYNISSIGLFGSYVNNSQTEVSDIDILIDYDKEKDFSLLDIVRIQNFLSDLLKSNVDIALKNSLKTGIGYYIQNEVIYV